MKPTTEVLALQLAHSLIERVQELKEENEKLRYENEALKKNPRCEGWECKPIPNAGPLKPTNMVDLASQFCGFGEKK